MQIHDHNACSHEEYQFQQRVIHHMQHSTGKRQRDALLPVCLAESVRECRHADTRQNEPDLGHG